MNRGFLGRLLAYPLIVAHAGLIYGVYYIYKFKSPWYNPPFIPPNRYVKGPLANDQGTLPPIY